MQSVKQRFIMTVGADGSIVILMYGLPSIEGTSETTI